MKKISNKCFFSTTFDQSLSKRLFFFPCQVKVAQRGALLEPEGAIYRILSGQEGLFIASSQARRGYLSHPPRPEGAIYRILLGQKGLFIASSQARRGYLSHPLRPEGLFIASSKARRGYLSHSPRPDGAINRILLGHEGLFIAPSQARRNSDRVRGLK